MPFVVWLIYTICAVARWFGSGQSMAHPEVWRTIFLSSPLLFWVGGPIVTVAPDIADALRHNTLRKMGLEEVKLWGAELGSRGKWSRAIKAYQTAIELDPYDVPARRGLAWVYWRKGNLIKARDKYQEALAVDPGDADARDFLNEVERQISATSAPPSLDRDLHDDQWWDNQIRERQERENQQYMAREIARAMADELERRKS